MSLCSHCVAGVRHEGTPEGQFTKVGGVDSYVATPKGDYPKDKVVLFLSDVFGLKLQNNLLLADDYARNGFKVVEPDLFEGDALPEDALHSGKVDFGAWLAKHGMDRVVGIIRTVIDALKAEGVTKFAAVGFCFGARPAFDLAFNNELQVVAVSHPSLLQIPADLEKYASQSKAPLLINSCETDPQFPIDAQAKADEILGGGKFAPGYVRTYWEGCTHGFAVRGDISDPKVKAGKEGAFKATVEFLIKHL
ncbi:alpha/beta-hydrolase [Trametes coccinea BRFM310]|uniref:Alpha/beta-hydrolase n=1 Tax=Trametes coccinea (strain BRFM310) TaxID=1353009 RepID=A0A1Y2IUP8_TRAC3|nr:alpha/beta-hydrolase [Trametes coccinea BRFM310]